MEKKTFQIETYYIISCTKKVEPTLFITTNEKKEMDFVKKTFSIEGVGLNEEKAKEMMREFLVSQILPKGVFVNSQKSTIIKKARLQFICKYYVNLTEEKVNWKNGSFMSIHKVMDTKNNLSPELRNFLINYVEERKNMTAEE